MTTENVLMFNGITTHACSYTYVFVAQLSYNIGSGCKKTRLVRSGFLSIGSDLVAQARRELSITDTFIVFYKRQNINSDRKGTLYT